MFGQKALDALILKYKIDISDYMNRVHFRHAHGISLSRIDKTSEGFISYNEKPCFIHIDERCNSKFHFYHCGSFTKSKNSGRKNRYVASLGIDGLFSVTVAGNRKEKKKLMPCKNCIGRQATESDASGFGHYINLKVGQDPFDFHDRYKQGIYTIDDIREYMNNSLFLQHSIKQFSGQNRATGYTEDWEEVSFAYRHYSKFICENCNKNLSNEPQYCHTHHIDGHKQNNSPHNLKCLCKICHAKEPEHGHMKVSELEKRIISRCP